MTTLTGTFTGTFTPAATPRPAGNTGAGFFVSGPRLYAPNGQEHRIRGVNRCHYDSDSAAGIKLAGANTVRIFVESNYGILPPALAAICQTQHVANGQLVIPVCPFSPAGVQTSGSTDPTLLATITAWWTAAAASWLPLNNSMILNIANEWGPANSQAWATANITVIQALRAEGFLCPILIDSGGSGQDDADILQYAAQVLAADPQKNVLFGIHLYGTATEANYQARIQSYAALSGVCVVVSEFGPGLDVGPSPTMVTPQQIIAACEVAGLGWCPWAFDDNNEAGGMTSPTGWFGMTLAGPGIYNTLADLTAYGQAMIPYWSALAKYPT